MSRMDWAERHFFVAAEPGPETAVGLGEAGIAFHTGDWVGAVDGYLDALGGCADPLGPLLRVLHGLDRLCAWDARREVAETLAPLLDEVAEGERPPTLEPMCHLSLPLDAARFRRLATQNAELAATAVEDLPPLPQPVPLAGRKFRVGIVSLDWRSHTCGLPLAPISDALVDLGVEVVSYSLGPASRAMTGARHEYRNLTQLEPSDAAVVIAADRVDALIDTTRHTRGGAAWLAWNRLARVQVAGWGYGGTTGGSCMDAFVTDSLMAPAGSEDEFCERLLRLPFCLPMASEPLPALTERSGPPVAACFAASYKIGAETFAGWLRLMRAVPDLRLMLTDPGAQTAANLAAEAAAAGIDAGRLMFVPRLDRGVHLRRLAEGVDLVLDVAALGGSASIPDAMVAGVPALAVSGGGGPAEAGGAAMLTACGFADWIAEGQEAHLDQAARLLSDRAALARARGAMREAQPVQRLAAAGAVKPLVDALEEMWAAAG
jgi:predicted O-linked N-acetylglucosamine transferase (SPINDLY family)